jgi:hypothetical protein
LAGREALGAKAGHPAPFNLQCVEIDNVVAHSVSVLQIRAE